MAIALGETKGLVASNDLLDMVDAEESGFDEHSGNAHELADAESAASTRALLLEALEESRVIAEATAGRYDALLHRHQVVPSYIDEDELGAIPFLSTTSVRVTLNDLGKLVPSLWEEEDKLLED